MFNYDNEFFQLKLQLDTLRWSESELADDDVAPPHAPPHLATVRTLPISSSVFASCERISDSCSGLITSLTFQTPGLGAESGPDLLRGTRGVSKDIRYGVVWRNSDDLGEERGRR